MVAALLPAPDPHLPHVLRLPPPDQAGTAAQEVRQGLADTAAEGEVTLLAIDWRLPLPELRSLQRLLSEQNLVLRAVRSNQPETLVAAAALDSESASPVVVMDDDNGCADEELSCSLANPFGTSGCCCCDC